MEIFQSYKRMYLTYQTPDMSNTEYLDQFKACVDVIEAYCGTPGAHLGLTKYILAEMPGLDVFTYPSGFTSYQANAERKTARERYLACLFISGDYNVRCRAIKRDFRNEYPKYKDSYPKTFEAALK